MIHSRVFVVTGTVAGVGIVMIWSDTKKKIFEIKSEIVAKLLKGIDTSNGLSFIHKSLAETTLEEGVVRRRWRF
jgi:hypothetical protein